MESGAKQLKKNIVNIFRRLQGKGRPRAKLELTWVFLCRI